jgi:hypothetical protein
MQKPAKPPLQRRLHHCRRAQASDPHSTISCVFRDVTWNAGRLGLCVQLSIDSRKVLRKRPSLTGAQSGFSLNEPRIDQGHSYLANVEEEGSAEANENPQ